MDLKRPLELPVLFYTEEAYNQIKLDIEVDEIEGSEERMATFYTIAALVPFKSINNENCTSIHFSGSSLLCPLGKKTIEDLIEKINNDENY